MGSSFSSSKPAAAATVNQGSTAPTYQYNRLSDLDALTAQQIAAISPGDVNQKLINVDGRETWDQGKQDAYDALIVKVQNYRPDFGGGGRRRKSKTSRRSRSKGHKKSGKRKNKRRGTRRR